MCTSTCSFSCPAALKTSEDDTLTHNAVHQHTAGARRPCRTPTRARCRVTVSVINAPHPANEGGRRKREDGLRDYHHNATHNIGGTQRRSMLLQPAEKTEGACASGHRPSFRLRPPGYHTDSRNTTVVFANI